MPLPPPSPSSIALVTGASSGIGTEIARELARRGHGLVLVARREERLRELADELARAHGVRAEAIGSDLADPASRDELGQALRERELDVEILVNNAGFGSGGDFQDLDPEVEVGMVRLNVEAVVALCAAYAREMVDRRRGAILNVASIAGYQPIPRQATYAASKAFVVSFTEALASDLHGTGVTVTALCPGPVRTEFVEAAGIGEAAAESAPSFLWMEAGEVARAGVEGLEAGRRSVVPGPFNVASTMFGRVAPHGMLMPLYRRFYPVGK